MEETVTALEGRDFATRPCPHAHLDPVLEIRQQSRSFTVPGSGTIEDDLDMLFGRVIGSRP